MSVGGRGGREGGSGKCILESEPTSRGRVLLLLLHGQTNATAVVVIVSALAGEAAVVAIDSSWLIYHLLSTVHKAVVVFMYVIK